MTDYTAEEIAETDYEGDETVSDEPAIVQTTKRGKGKAASGDAAMKDWLRSFGHLQYDSVQREGFNQIITTGIPTFDYAMGVGGLPLGSLVTVYGKEGVAKTAFWQHIAGQAQKQFPKKKVMVFDGEGMDVPTAERNGLDLSQERFASGSLFYYPIGVNNDIAYETMIMMIERMLTDTGKGVPAPDGIVVVVDSLDSIMSMAEMEMDADAGGPKFGSGMAKASSLTIKRLIGRLKATDSLMIVVQQGKPDLSAQAKFGPPPMTTSGGTAWKFYSKVRIKMARVAWIKDGDNGRAGMRIEGNLDKNKYNVTSKFEADFRFDWSADYSGGWDTAAGLIEVGSKDNVGLVQIAPRHVEFVGFTKEDGEAASFNGKNAAREWLISNPSKLNELDRQIRAKLYGR